VAKAYWLLSGYRTTRKLPPVHLFHHDIHPREIFKPDTLFCGTLHALLLWTNMAQSAPDMSDTFLQIFHKPHFNLELDYIFKSQ